MVENEPLHNFENLRSLVLEYQDFEIDELENSILNFDFRILKNLQYLEILTLEEDQDFHFNMLQIKLSQPKNSSVKLIL